MKVSNRSIFNTFFLASLMLLISCSDFNKEKAYVFFIDYHYLKEGANDFWQQLEKTIEKKGLDDSTKSVSITIYTITENGLGSEAFQQMSYENDPDFKSNPTKFSIQKAQELKEKIGQDMELERSKIYHIAPTIAYIDEALNQKGNKDLKVVFISNMMELYDGDVFEYRYDFLEKGGKKVNSLIIDKAIQDLENEASTFYQRYIAQYAAKHPNVEISLCLKNHLNAKGGLLEVKKYWRKFFNKVGYKAVFEQEIVF